MTLYQVTIRGKRRWRVDYTAGGRRIVRTFTVRAEAEAEAENVKAQQRAAGEAWLSLTAAERNELIRIHKLAGEAGASIDAVWRAWQASGGVADSVPLLSAVRDLLAAKTAAGRAPLYVKTLAIIAGKFAIGRENQPVSSVTTADLEVYLSGFNPSYRPTVRARLSTLFEFCVRRGWARDNPCARLERHEQPHTAPEILSVEQVVACLDHLTQHPRGLAWFVLSCLCGLRPEEAARTDWAAIDTAAGLVRVEAATSKMRWRRIVYPPPAAVAWLARARALGSPLPITEGMRTGAVRSLRGLMGLPEWPQDVTRHTAASYWLAACGDARHVADQLGHSLTVLRSRYAALVEKSEGERFWNAITCKESNLFGQILVDNK